jgi:pyruvate/2-oxoglutarate dehydrogenase complex dihydrolipoamide acyltransferase (E2) component
VIEVRMPRLSEAMTDGKLLVWSVAVGDRVEQGEQLAEVEADKANMEIEAPVSGTVLNLHGNPGDKIPVDAVLVELREEPSHTATAENGKMSVAQAPEATDLGQSPLERRQAQFSEGGEN